MQNIRIKLLIVVFSVLINPNTFVLFCDVHFQPILRFPTILGFFSAELVLGNEISYINGK